MAHRLETVADVGLDEALIRLAVEEHTRSRLPELNKLWTYYRNPLEPVGEGRALLPAQAKGLPRRLLRGIVEDPSVDDRSLVRREVVIENDIAWRVHTMVDFMLGKPIQLLSTADDEERRGLIEHLLDAAWEASGGIALLQDMALLGHVYGHVDLLLRVDEPALRALGAVVSRKGSVDEDELAEAARLLRIEVIEPTRGIPILNPGDYRTLDAYVIRFERELNKVGHKDGLRGALGRLVGEDQLERKRSTVTEIITPIGRVLMEGDDVVEETASGLLAGEMPVVHMQNVSQPFRYGGLGEVEALIPLQDELNTRLSDRASRVTLQSFKMYLARGIDGFERVPVGPGQVWVTDNPEASIESFGGDGASPSEERHIDEVREAMDKISAVPPLAGGVVRAKIGNLSSANALRITLMSLLSKTARKRVTYGRGIEQISGLMLTALDAAGVLRTELSERGVRIVWPEPVPEDARDQALVAQAKAELGVPREQVLAELGVAPTDPGVT